MADTVEELWENPFLHYEEYTKPISAGSLIPGKWYYLARGCGLPAVAVKIEKTIAGPYADIKKASAHIPDLTNLQVVEVLTRHCNPTFYGPQPQSGGRRKGKKSRKHSRKHRMSRKTRR